MIRICTSLLLLAASAAAGATEFTMQSGRLQFFGTQQGERFEGRFNQFEPKIRFDAAALDTSSLDVSIALVSADSANSERDDTLKTADFFDIATFPNARFVTTKIVATGGANYEADATLTIRDKTIPLKFPFSMVPGAEGRTQLTAKVTLNRLDFGIGTGDWADDGTIGHKVDVEVSLILVPKP